MFIVADLVSLNKYAIIFYKMCLIDRPVLVIQKLKSVSIVETNKLQNIHTIRKGARNTIKKWEAFLS